jgi:hypothetical protein
MRNNSAMTVEGPSVQLSTPVGSAVCQCSLAPPAASPCGRSTRRRAPAATRIGNSAPPALPSYGFVHAPRHHDCAVGRRSFLLVISIGPMLSLQRASIANCAAHGSPSAPCGRAIIIVFVRLRPEGAGLILRCTPPCSMLALLCGEFLLRMEIDAPTNSSSSIAPHMAPGACSPNGVT